jgi:DTW domain-containing protein YfiP
VPAGTDIFSHGCCRWTALSQPGSRDIGVAIRYPGRNVALGSRCPRCLFARCLCAEIPVVPTRTRVVIVRHHLERWRTSNTGRLAALALPNATIVDHGGGAEASPDAVPRDGAWLVYPEGPAWAEPPAPPPTALVIIDASWHQTRRMRQRLPVLRGLPVLRLPDVEMPAARMRESPGPGLVSTIEAIARALRLVEGDAPADALERLFAIAVARLDKRG